VPKDRIDFSGVPQEIRSGGKSYVPPGDYLVKVLKCDKQWKNDDHSNPAYYKWQFQVVEPKKFKGTSVYNNTSLAPNALFNLRNLIFAVLGKNVAGRQVNFDPATLYGKTLGISTDDREHQDKTYTDVVDMYPADDYDSRKEDGAQAEADLDEVLDEEEEDLEEVEVDEL